MSLHIDNLSFVFESYTKEKWNKELITWIDTTGSYRILPTIRDDEIFSDLDRSEQHILLQWWIFEIMPLFFEDHYHTLEIAFYVAMKIIQKEVLQILLKKGSPKLGFNEMDPSLEMDIKH